MIYPRLKITLLTLVLLHHVAAFSIDCKREMRAAWIATVANIDWPTQPGLDAAKQRTEMCLMLDSLHSLHINAIVLQIRPTADAFYPSTLEPWSQWLTGKQGLRPTPYYDPLQFAIEEAHQRCMEVHVWLNPYRVTNGPTKLDSTHIFNQHPEWFVTYGGKRYFNPGLDQTRAWLCRVVADIVQRYDIDAVHMDDYFYPYRVKGEEFPDEKTFKANPRGFSDKNAWRRNNVDMAIAEIQHTIKDLKPWVEFGISPFGVWRNKSTDPNGSNTQAGVQNYDDLYADILKWLREGNIDYVAPQLYWEIGKKTADYKILAEWWSKNSYGRNLYIGLYASQLGNTKAAKAWNTPNELCRQLALNKQTACADGVILYSARPLLRNPQGICDSLQNHYFRYPALCPINRNVEGDAPAQPQNLHVIKDSDACYLLWDDVHESGGCATAYYVVYAFKGKTVGNLNDPANIMCLTADTRTDLAEFTRTHAKGHYTFVVTAINRYKHESIPTYGITRKL